LRLPAFGDKNKKGTKCIFWKARLVRGKAIVGNTLWPQRQGSRKGGLCRRVMNTVVAMRKYPTTRHRTAPR
jgi:hypothetical protein